MAIASFCLFVFYFIIVLNCQSVSSGIDERSDRIAQYHEFEFPFIRDGEILLLSGCSAKGCAAKITLYGWLKREVPLTENIRNEYVLKFAVFELMHVIDFYITGSENNVLPAVEISVILREKTTIVPVTLRIFHKETGIEVFNRSYSYIALRASDLGLQSNNNIDNHYQTYITENINSDSEPLVLDFIELGTSNFNTCTQVAEAQLRSGAIQQVRGVAVEAIGQYLEALPPVPGVSKVHGAITSDSKEEAVMVYYIPESVLDKVSWCTEYGAFYAPHYIHIY